MMIHTTFGYMTAQEAKMIGSLDKELKKSKDIKNKPKPRK